MSEEIERMMNAIIIHQIFGFWSATYKIYYNDRKKI